MKNDVVLFSKFLYISLFLFSVSILYSDESRLALIIGNSNYDNVSSLNNPKNDAVDISASLEKLGFEVNNHVDASRREMYKAIKDFGSNLKNYDVGLFYYAGHGVQYEGENYLVCSDSDIGSEEDIPFEAIELNRILSEMDRAGNSVNIIILDACRNNPYTSKFRSINRGLSIANTPIGSLIIYATSPGDVAIDGEGRNGVFTSALLEHLEEPGKEVEQLLKDVRRDVQAATYGKQIPWSNSSLTDSFYFSSESNQYMPDDSFLTLFPDELYAPPVSLAIAESPEGPFNIIGNGYGREFRLPSGLLWTRISNETSDESFTFKYDFDVNSQYNLVPRVSIPMDSAFLIHGSKQIPARPPLLPESEGVYARTWKSFATIGLGRRIDQWGGIRSGNRAKYWRYHGVMSAVFSILVIPTSMLGVYVYKANAYSEVNWTPVDTLVSLGISQLFMIPFSTIFYLGTSEKRNISVPIPGNIQKNQEEQDEWDRKISENSKHNQDLIEDENQNRMEWYLQIENDNSEQVLEVIND